MPAAKPISRFEVLARIKAGETGAAIAKSLGVSHQRIFQITRRAGLSLGRGPKSALRRVAAANASRVQS